MKKTRQAYREILDLLEKHKDITVFDIEDLTRKADNHIFGIGLKEKYGFDIDPKNIESTQWQKLKDGIHVSFMDGEIKKVSWSDDGRQPKNETLLVISFSIGAYIFGEHYPTELFDKFFDELKSYSPKYTDHANHSLYFSLDNAGKVFNDYDSIFNKYKSQSGEYFKKMEIERLELQLKKMKA